MLYHNSRPNLFFAVKSVDASELVSNIMMKSMELADWNVGIFFEKLAKPPHAHLTPLFHISEAYAFQGAVIATDIGTAYKLIQFPSPNPKFFFLNDIEWIRFPQKQYDQLEFIYRNPELILITRCLDHKTLVENCWNVKVDRIIENYNFFSTEHINYFKNKIDNLTVCEKPIEHKNILEYV